MPALCIAAILAPLAADGSRAGSMDLEAANRIVDGYTRHVMSRLPGDWRRQEEQRMRQSPPRIAAGGIYQITAPEGRLAFEYDADDRLLHCDAVIHRMRREYSLFGLHREEIRTALESAAAAGVDTGGGEILWDPEAQGFFLRRTYSEPPQSMRRTNRELDRLLAAGEEWFRKRYLEAVNSHLETLRPPESATGRDGDLRVTIVLTHDLAYQDLFRRPPEAMQPQVVSRSEFAHGQEVWALALFSGAAAGDDGLVKLRAQYTFLYPDGSVHGSPVGNLWWSESPPPDHLQMSEFRAAIELGDDTPPGDYRAGVKVCEPTLERCVTAETPFRVRPAEDR